MAITFSNLSKQISIGKFFNYFVLISKDVISPSSIINIYKKQLQYPELNFIELDGEKLDFTLLSESIEKLPFMDNFSMVVVNKANFVTTDGTDKNKVLKELNKLSVPKHCVLILQTYIEEDENLKKNKKLPKLELMGANIVYTPKISLTEAKEELVKRNIKVDNSTALFVYEKTGNNLDLFINECLKVSMIPIEHMNQRLLEEVITKTVSNSVFDIVDTVTKERNIAKCFDISNNLMEKGTHPLEIFGALMGQIKLLYYAKQFMLNNSNENEFATKFKIHPFRAKIGFQQAARFEEKALEKLFIHCNEYSNNIKLSPNPKIELEKLILRMFQ